MPATPGVSLKKLGLVLDDLACPAGGRHEIPEKTLLAVKASGGGEARCLKCRGVLVLHEV